MVSFQLKSDAEVSSRLLTPIPLDLSFVAMSGTSPTWMRTCSILRINIVAVDGMLSRILGLDTSLFENHLVVELLWPCRERRARMITVAWSNVFNVLSANFKSGAAYSNSIGSKLCRDVWYVADSRIIFLRFLNLLLNIVDVKTMPWYDYVLSSLVLADEMLLETEHSSSEAAYSNSFGSKLCRDVWYVVDSRIV